MTDGWTALAESTGRLPGLALNLAQLQQQGQHMRALEADSQKRLAFEGERVGIEKINAIRQKDLYDVQKREAHIKLSATERDMELIPVSETLASLGVKRPAEQKFLMDYAGPYVQNGPASGLPSIQRNHAQEVYGKLQKDVDANIKLDTIRAREAQKEIDAIDAQMNNPETSGKLKPEQVAQLQKQRSELVMERTVSDNSVRKLTREKGKESLKNFWNPVTQSWVQKNIVTDDVTGLIPEEIKKAQITAEGLDLRAEKTNATRLAAANIAANKATKGNDPVEKKIKEIDTYIRVNYDAKMREIERKLAKVTWVKGSEGEANRLQDQLSAFEAEREKAVDTQNMLRNGEIEPGAVVWGKQPSGAQKESTLLSDLMKHGYTKEAAAGYIKRAKAAGKL